MDEAEGLGMEGLAGADLEAVLDELAVLAVNSALADFGAAVTFVVKERMPERRHMHADLVRTSRLQPAFDDRNKAEPFQDFIMRTGVFPFLRVVIYTVAQAVVGVAANGTFHSPLLFFDITPDDSDVLPLDGMFEELFGQALLHLDRLRHQQEAGGILIDPVHQDAHPLILCIRSLGNTQIV